MPFTKTFVATKTILVLASLLILIHNPKLTIPILLLNIGIAIAESAYNGFLINALIGIAIFIWISRLRYDDASIRVPVMIALYTLWNIQFHYLHVRDIVTALSHTIIPAVVSFGVYRVAPEYTLRVFLLTRLVALSTHGLHYASPATCHSKDFYTRKIL